MGKNEKDAKYMLNMIEKTIIQLEKRQEELMAAGDPETGELPLDVQKELGMIRQNLSLIKSMKQEVEETLKQAKTEEEKRKIVKAVGLAMLVGAINESLRQTREYGKTEETPQKKSFETLFDALLDSGKFRFVQQNELEDIMADEELRQMAMEDPQKLLREEREFRDEYEEMMTREMDQAGIALGDNFEQNEEKFREYLKQNNGYEFALSRNEQFIEETILAKDSTVGTEEDKEYFREVLKEIRELSRITRELQKKYILEEDSFEKGNGFTKELVEREKALIDKMEKYSTGRMSELLKYKPEDKRFIDCGILYERSQMLVGPAINQLKRDSVLARNNDLRRRMERWTVYQQLPANERPAIIQENVAIQNRKNAIAKLRRMDKKTFRREMADRELTKEEFESVKAVMRAGGGDLRSSTAVWTVEETQNLLEKLDGDAPLKKDDLPMIREALAYLVLYQMLLDDLRRPEGEPRYYYDKMKKGVSQAKFQDLAKELSETEEFRKTINPLIREKDIKENVYRFLAFDFEKNVVKQVYSKMKKRKDKQKDKQKKAEPVKEAKQSTVKNNDKSALRKGHIS